MCVLNEEAVYNPVYCCWLGIGNINNVKLRVFSFSQSPLRSSNKGIFQVAHPVVLANLSRTVLMKKIHILECIQKSNRNNYDLKDSKNERPMSSVATLVCRWWHLLPSSISSYTYFEGLYWIELPLEANPKSCVTNSRVVSRSFRLLSECFRR